MTTLKMPAPSDWQHKREDTTFEARMRCSMVMLYFLRDMNVSALRRLVLPVLLAFPALLALGSGALASGASEIEGIWSFNGGTVGIQALTNGTFQGTVTAPTTFKSCPHPAEQVMWTDIRLQPDGSYWGYHQWYHGTSCEEDPQLGPTAWRVLHKTADTRYLEVCFSNPGTTQPKIAPDGTATEDTYGCVESALISELPGTGSSGGDSHPGVAGGVVLPPTNACVSQSSLKIALRNPKYDPLKEVVIRVNGKKVLTIRGVKHLRKGIILKKLPSGTYKVSVLAVTVLNQRLTGSSTYHSCTKGSGKIKLHGGKSHHHH
jgi:hypothetical protein